MSGPAPGDSPTDPTPEPGSEAELDLAAQPLDAEDQALLEQVAATWSAHDPVPAGLVERIEFALTLAALHAEVAELTRVDVVAAGARGSATEPVRTITFTSESLTTMVTVTPQPGGTIRVDGWAAPGAGIRVEVLTADGTQEATADEDGRFVFDTLAPGLVKFALHLVREDGRPSTVLSPAVEL